MCLISCIWCVLCVCVFVCGFLYKEDGHVQVNFPSPFLPPSFPLPSRHLFFLTAHVFSVELVRPTVSAAHGAAVLGAKEAGVDLAINVAAHKEAVATIALA